MRRRTFRAAIVLCAVFGWPAAVSATPSLELHGEARQGAVIFGKTAPGVSVLLDGEALPVGPEGNFVIGFGRDHGREAALVLRYEDETVASVPFDVSPRTYDIQRIDGLPPRMVTPPAEALERIAREAREKKAARSDIRMATDYAGGFIWPVAGRISGVYGSQRVYNGEPRRPHYGIDIAAPAGTPVRAPAPGLVTLAEPDMYFEGGLVFLDHGHGLISVLMHLGTVEVAEGDTVERGERLGSVGATGRATGPHLDWRMYWRERRVDPATLVPPMTGGEPAPQTGG